MFTGIVQGLGLVMTVVDIHGIRRLGVDLPNTCRDSLYIGQSISVNGVCLTVVEYTEQGHVSFDVIDETLRLTNLGQLSPGDQINIERAARFGDEIGGHILSGHIHGQATVVEVVEQDSNLAIFWTTAKELQSYLLPKGYVSLNGCSLTVGRRQEPGVFSVHLIPETRRLTTFGSISVSDILNLEVDTQTQIIVDTVNHILDQRV